VCVCVCVCVYIYIYIYIYSIKLLKTERNLPYIRNQSVPRCKHFSSRL